MTMHGIILDTLWTIASEALCPLTNTLNLSTTTLTETKVVAVTVTIVFGVGEDSLESCLENCSQKLEK